jgi:5-methylcytosine-specific restriction endonuclease McrA
MHYGMSAMDVSHNPQARKPYLYGTWRWQKKRKAQIAKEPLCRFCMDRGQVTPARIADHIEPHRGDLDKFWYGKLQSLCKRCHDSDKQRIERGGKPKPVIGDDGWPV